MKVERGENGKTKFVLDLRIVFHSLTAPCSTSVDPAMSLVLFSDKCPHKTNISGGMDMKSSRKQTIKVKADVHLYHVFVHQVLGQDEVFAVEPFSVVLRVLNETEYVPIEHKEFFFVVYN